jgi:aminoglycoside phosphotransferase (APT) family kinase protein
MDRMMDYASRWRWGLDAVSDPVLMHGDVNWDNIIVEDCDVVGLIDFDNVEIGTSDIEAWRLVGAIAGCGDTDVPVTPV